VNVLRGDFRTWDYAGLPAAATIGVFDGLHRGHQALVNTIVAEANQCDLAPVVITFERHPGHLLRPGRVPKRLTTNEQRLEIFGDLGVVTVALLEFDERVRSMEPEEVVTELLLGVFRTEFLTVGPEFRFGRDQHGDVTLLTALAPKHGFRFEPIPLHGDREPFRATAVRAALARGDLETTNRILGRPFQIRGKVIHGDGRGNAIGFPTANLEIDPDQALPRFGVYAVMAGVGGVVHPGVCNIGVRPTFEGASEALEVHLLEGGRDLYGEELSVDFMVRVRDEQKFDGIDALVTQIGRDVAAAAVMLG